MYRLGKLTDFLKSAAIVIGVVIWGILRFVATLAAGLVFLILASGAISVIWDIAFPTSQEDKDWSATYSGSDSDQINKLLSFMEHHPASGRALEVPKRIEQNAWKLATTGKIYGSACFSSAELTPREYKEYQFSGFTYVDYVRAYPSGIHVDEAKAKLEEECWNEASRSYEAKEESASPSAHLRYLELYPQGKWRKDANKFIATRFYNLGVARRSRDYLQKAVDHMPGNHYLRDNAVQALSEVSSWEAAVTTDTYAAFHEHLKTWPNGHDYDVAGAMMSYHGTWKQLPLADKVLRTISKDDVAPIDIDAEETTAELNTTDPQDLKAKCEADQDFIDLIKGYVWAAEHYEDYRRKLQFGFVAPFGDRAKVGSIDLLKTLDPEQVKPLAQMAWTKAPLTDEQRRQLKRLALVALEHEKTFNAGYDTVAADILAARWTAFQFDGWYELPGFPKPSNSCFEVGFDVFPSGITQTLFDFWYLRNQEGTQKVVSAAFAVAAESDQAGPP